MNNIITSTGTRFGTGLQDAPYPVTTVTESVDFVPGTYLRTRDAQVPTTPGVGFGLAAPKISIPPSVRGGSASSVSDFSVTPFEAVDTAGVYPSAEELANAERGEFSKGVLRSIQQTQAIAYGGIGALADKANLNGIRDWGYEGYVRNMEEAAQYPAAVPSISDINSVGTFGQWAAGTAGSLIPSIATSLLGGGIGGFVGKKVATSAVKKATARLIEDQVANGVERGIATQIVAQQLASKFINRGAQAGLVATTGLLETGSNWGQDVEAHGLEGTSPGMDIAFGLASGLSEAIMGAEGSLIRAVTGQAVTDEAERSFRRVLATELIKNSVQEGAQEGFQQILSAVNANLQDHNTILTENDLQDIIDAAAAGALGGVGFGAAHVARTRARNRGERAGGTPSPLVDKPSIIEQQYTVENPYLNAVREREQLLQEEEARVQQAIQTIDSSWQAQIDNANTAISNLDKSISEVDDIRNPKYAALSQESRQEQRNKLTRQKAVVLARLAQIKKNREAAIEAEVNRLRQVEKTSGRHVISAQEKQNAINQRKLQQVFTNDPEVVDNLVQLSTNVETFTNRQGEILDTRIRRIQEAKSSLVSALNEVISRAKQTGRNIPANLLDYAEGREKYLNSQLDKALKKQEQLRSLATNLIKNIASATDNTLGQIHIDAQRLFSLADNTAEALSNADLTIQGNALASEVYRKNLTSLNKKIQAARDTLSSENARNNPILYTADMLLANASNQLQAEINSPVVSPIEGISAAELAEQQAAANRRAREEAAVERELHDDLQAAEQKRREWAAWEAQQAAERLGYGGSMGAEAAATRQTNQDLQALQTHLSNMEQTQVAGDAAQRVADTEALQSERQSQVEQAQAAMQERQLEEQRTVADEAQQNKISQGVGEIETRNLLPQQRQVLNWIENTLKRLPGLRDVTIVASDITDTRIPVALQNALFNTTHNSRQQVAACYYNGKVYLFADQFKTKQQAVRAMIHEGVVHFGLRSIMTKEQLGYFLNSVFNSFANTAEWKIFAKENPQYFEGTFDKARQAEEFVAWIGERKRLSQILDRSPLAQAYNKFKSFIKSILQSLGMLKVTEADILDVISSSAHYLANSDAKGWYTNINPSVLSITGEEAVSPSAGPNTVAWGLYFSTLGDLNKYNAKVELSVSGRPGEAFSYYPVTEENILNLNASIADQSQLVQELIGSFLSESDVQVIPNQETGKFDAMLVGKKVGEFDSEIEAYRYLNSDEAKTQVTGKDVYDYFANQRNQKDTSTALSKAGIRGAKYQSSSGPVYVFFSGDNLSTDPYSPTTEYEEPMYKLTRSNSVEGEDGLREFVGNAAENTFIADVYRKYHDENRWLKKLEGVRQLGNATNPDGTLKEHTFIERVVEYFHDSYRRVQLVQRYLKDKYGRDIINYTTNIYKNLTGLTNRISYAQTELWRALCVPLLKDLQNIQLPGVDKNIKGYGDYVLAAFDDYVYARHAPERNANINSRITPRSYINEDGLPTKRYSLSDPSGMSNEQAARIVEKYDNVPGFKEAAEKLDAINRTRLNILLANKFISRADYEAMINSYQYYVPLKNWNDFIADVAPGYMPVRSRSGISVGGKRLIRESKGRNELPQSPTVNSILQLLDTQAVIMKNDVSRSLLQLVKSTNDKDLWEVSKPTKGENGSYFRIQKGPDGKLHFHKRAHTQEGEGHKMINVIDDNGNLVKIAVKDKALAAALRGENKSPTGPLVDGIRKLTSQMSLLQTARNPAFILTNPVRDIETAILNLGNVISDNESRGLLDKSSDITKGIRKDAFNPKFVKFLYKVIKDGATPDMIENQGELLREFQDFSRNGGRTRMLGIHNFEATYKKVRKELKSKNLAMQQLNNAAEVLDRLSDISENMIRFSVYRNVQKAFETNLRDRASKGEFTPEQLAAEIELAKQKSANIALECTVNFTRKGSGAGIFNALYAFSSASIQGNVRILQNLWRRGDSPAKNFARISKYLAVGSTGAIAQGILCRMWMGDDDDGINKYDKIPDYVKYNNIIIPFWDGGYIKIPLAYGYNIFWIFGQCIDNVARGLKKPTSAAVDIIKESFSNFSPINPTDEGINAFIPTIFRPIIQVATNTKFSGAPIRPENTAKDTPDSQKYWSKTPEAYKFIASFLNTMTGGSPTESGLLDVSPTTLEHIASGYLGGIYRLGVDTLGLITSPITGSDIDVNSLPIANRFLGSTGYSNTSALYNKIAGQVDAAANAMKIADSDPSKTPQDRWTIRRENRVAASLEPTYRNVQRTLSQIKRQEQALAKQYPSKGFSRAYNEKMELLQKRRELAMKRLVRAANKAGLPILD
jgi:hypothetical protein